MIQKPNVSIVIPVYNEEQQLAACLDSIARQTVKPFEVIVVDNNSTDNTVAIARSYSFVRLLHETQQGVVHARNRGFYAARGDIIGRLDTDTRLSANWVERIIHIFSDPAIDAVSGSIGFHDVPFSAFFSNIDGFFRRYLARNLARHDQLFLYGSNMAMRKAAWQHIANDLCNNHSFHEDIDMAAHFAATPFVIAFDSQLRVEVSARRIDSSPASYYNYVLANSRTYAAHDLKGRYYMYPVEWLTIIFYAPLRVLYRSYEVSTGRFSWSHFIRPSYQQRVSPVSDN